MGHMDVNGQTISVKIERKEIHPLLLHEYLAGENKSDLIVITDEKIALLYPELLEGFKWMAVPSGEKSKSLTTYGQILENLVAHGITRKGLVVAFGGGVVGDLAGFVAATYMRGIRLMGIPTSLLAMVDSCVGGKVAINLMSGKNLVGAFYQPEQVIINPSFLNTLPKREYSNGMAEVIKYAIGFDEVLFEMLEGDAESNFDELIARCVNIKKDIVIRDPYDEGERNLLNFGHTIGHAVEVYYGYDRYLHGEAVAIGIVAKSRVALSEGVISEGLYDRIVRVIRKYGLPTALVFDDASEQAEGLNTLLRATLHDKKALQDRIRWIGLSAPFQLEIRVNSVCEAMDMFKGGLSE